MGANSNATFSYWNRLDSHRSLAHCLLNQKQTQKRSAFQTIITNNDFQDIHTQCKQHNTIEAGRNIIDTYPSCIGSLVVALDCFQCVCRLIHRCRKCEKHCCRTLSWNIYRPRWWKFQIYQKYLHIHACSNKNTTWKKMSRHRERHHRRTQSYRPTIVFVKITQLCTQMFMNGNGLDGSRFHVNVPNLKGKESKENNGE